ncbi:MAG TPA: hypothetical protein VEO54_21250 [Thermoanaerobaculia bacterium]|nr:hypothetical protein [Thermoanaerobaculia bacterium]
MPIYFPQMHGSDPAQFYKTWSERLRSIGIEEYGIPAEDAEQLAHEVLLSSLHAAHADATPEIWLPATMRSACRHHVARRPPGEGS